MTESRDDVLDRQAAELGAPRTEVIQLPPDQVAANRRAWLDALRSDDYEQGTGVLRHAVDPGDDGENGGESEGADDGESPAYRYCCLGVAELLRGALWDETDRVVAPNVVSQYLGDGEVRYVVGEVTANGSVLTAWGQVWLGVVVADPCVTVRDEYEGWIVRTLSALNDDLTYTFTQIADAVEDQGSDWTGAERQALELARTRADATGDATGDAESS